MSAMRSVCGTVAANLVIGDMISTCGRSCSEPILCWRKRALSADHQQRTLGAKRVGDAGHGVGRSRSGGRHNATDFAALARIAVRRMRGDLFMAHVDDLDAFVDAAVVDVDDMAAAERPDHLDAFVLERLGDQMPAGDHRVRSLLFWIRNLLALPSLPRLVLLKIPFFRCESAVRRALDRAIGPIHCRSTSDLYALDHKDLPRSRVIL